MGAASTREIIMAIMEAGTRGIIIMEVIMEAGTRETIIMEATMEAGTREIIMVGQDQIMEIMGTATMEGLTTMENKTIVL